MSWHRNRRLWDVGGSHSSWKENMQIYRIRTHNLIAVMRHCCTALFWQRLIPEENSPKWFQDCHSSLQNAGMVKFYLIYILTTFLQTVMMIKKKPHAHGPAYSRWQIWDWARQQSCSFNPFLKTWVGFKPSSRTKYMVFFEDLALCALQQPQTVTKKTDCLTLEMEKNKCSGVHAFANTLHLIKWTLNPVSKMANSCLICLILQQKKIF